MNNIIKLASIELNKSNDVVKTAGVLRMLKNKFLSLFDNEMSKNVDQMLETTNNIKPLLSETYKVIKKIEESINDLDVRDYNTNIEILKIKLNELNDAIKNTNEIMPKDEALKSEIENSDVVSEVEQKLSEKQKEEPDGSGVNLLQYKREYANLPEGAAIYKGIKTLSELGVKSQDILPNKNTLRAFMSSWSDAVNPKTSEEGKELLEDQNKISEQDIINIFYNKIPEMAITQIKGREINSVDDTRFGKKGTPKPGYLEVIVVGPVLPLPPPIDYWKLKMKFWLIDTRKKADDPLKFKIYRQLVIAAMNDSKDETYLGKKEKVSSE